MNQRHWRKSTYSADSANCVEVALSATGVGMRDSKNPNGPQLSYSAHSWTTFLGAVRAGEFDRPARS